MNEVRPSNAEIHAVMKQFWKFVLVTLVGLCVGAGLAVKLCFKNISARTNSNWSVHSSFPLSVSDADS